MPDSGIDEHLAADHTREIRAEENGTPDAHAVVSGLQDGVLLGMKPSAKLVPLPGRDLFLVPQAADIRAVSNAGRDPVVARGEDFLLCTDLPNFLQTASMDSESDSSPF